jgi:hypothetical protein
MVHKNGKGIRIVDEIWGDMGGLYIYGYRICKIGSGITSTEGSWDCHRDWRYIYLSISDPILSCDEGR